MKVILEFTLPEEKEEFQLAVNGSEIQSRIDDVKHYLRNEYKYTEHTPEIAEYLEKIRTDILNILDDTF